MSIENSLLPQFPAMAAAAAVLNPFAVISETFCSQDPVDLTVTQTFFSITQADFIITDVNGRLVFKSDGKIMSIHGRRVLHDPLGNPVVTILPRIVTLHKSFDVYRGDSTDSWNLLFIVKKHNMVQFKTSLDVFLVSNQAKEYPDFTIRGGFIGRSCTVYHGNTNKIVAQVKSKYNARKILLGKDTYKLTVYPGVDGAFVASLVVILDGIIDST